MQATFSLFGLHLKEYFLVFGAKASKTGAGVFGFADVVRGEGGSGGGAAAGPGRRQAAAAPTDGGVGQSTVDLAARRVTVAPSLYPDRRP